MRKWVDAANTVWFPGANIIFDFDESAGSADFETWNATLLNTVPADEAGHATYRGAANVWALHFHHTKLVVFFRANGGMGFSWGPTSNFFVSMPSYIDSPIWKPDDGGGQDPETTADGVGDTNPDFSDACVPTDSLTCAGRTFGYNDELWDPPWSNVMRYHDCLPEDLTDDQVDVINLTLQHPVRANLLQ